MNALPRSPAELAFGVMQLTLMTVAATSHAVSALATPDDRALPLLCAALPFVPLLWWGVRLQRLRSAWTAQAAIIAAMLLCLAVLTLSGGALHLLTGQPLAPARVALLIGGALSLGGAVLLLRCPPAA